MVSQGCWLWLLLLCLQSPSRLHCQSTSRNQQPTPVLTDVSLHRYEPPVTKEVLNSTEASRVQRYTRNSPRFAVLVPEDFYDEYSESSDNGAEEAGNYRELNSRNQPNQGTNVGSDYDQTEMNKEDKHSESEVNKGIKEVFSRKDKHQHKKNHYKLQQNIPYKLIIRNDFMPGQKAYRHKQQLHGPETSTLRKGQRHPDRQNQHNSEEIFNQLLGSNGINLDTSNKTIPIKDAYLSKTTTYNITKLIDENNKNSFLFEKKVNISTNLKYLDSKNTYTNSDTHSSSFQTILGNGGDEKESKDYIPVRIFLTNGHLNNMDNKLERKQLMLGNIEESGEEEESSGEKAKEKNNTTDQTIPSAFFGGHYESNINEDGSSAKIVSVKKNKMSSLSIYGKEQKAPSEFEGGQFIQESNKDSTTNFVGGQFVKEPGKKDDELDRSKLGNNIVGGQLKEAVANVNSALSDPEDDQKIDFVDGQFVAETGEKDNGMVGLSKIDYQQEGPTEFVGRQFVEEPGNKKSEVIRLSNSRDEQRGHTDFVGGQFIKVLGKEDDDILGSSSSEFEKKGPTDFVGGQFVEEQGKKDNSHQSNNGDEKKDPMDFVGGQFIEPQSKNETFDNEVQTVVMPETTTSNVASDIPSLSLKENKHSNNRTKEGMKQKIKAFPDNDATQKGMPDIQNKKADVKSVKPALEEHSKDKNGKPQEDILGSLHIDIAQKGKLHTNQPNIQPTEEEETTMISTEKYILGSMYTFSTATQISLMQSSKDELTTGDLTGPPVTDTSLTRSPDLHSNEETEEGKLLSEDTLEPTDINAVLKESAPTQNMSNKEKEASLDEDNVDVINTQQVTPFNLIPLRKKERTATQNIIGSTTDNNAVHEDTTELERSLEYVVESSNSVTTQRVNTDFQTEPSVKQGISQNNDLSVKQKVLNYDDGLVDAISILGNPVLESGTQASAVLGVKDLESNFVVAERNVENDVNKIIKISHDSLPRDDIKSNINKGMSSKSKAEDASINSSTLVVPKKTTGSRHTDANENGILQDITFDSSTTTPLGVTTQKYTVLPVNSDKVFSPSLLKENAENRRLYTTMSDSKKNIVFETINDDVDVIVSVSNSPGGKTEEQASILEDVENTQVKSQSIASKSDAAKKKLGDEEVSENDNLRKASPKSKPNEEMDNVLLSSTSEERDESSGEIVGNSNVNEQQTILERDPENGQYVTEVVGNYFPSYIKEPSNIEDIVYEASHKSEESDGISEGGVDKIVGDFSNVEHKRLKSKGVNSTDKFSVPKKENKLGTVIENTPRQSLENASNMEVVDEVELYAGNNPNSEFSNIKLDEFRKKNYSPSFERSKNLTGAVEPKLYNSNKEYLTELCLPLSNEKDLSLLDLLTGKFYLEKDGNRIPLFLKENPMKNCTSGSKTCKLFLDFKKKRSQTLEAGKSVDVNQDEVNEELLSNSKNEKRDIADEDLQLIKSEHRIERSTEGTDKEISNEKLEHIHEEELPFDKKITNALMKEFIRQQPEMTNSADYSLEELENHDGDEPSKFDLQSMQPGPKPIPYSYANRDKQNFLQTLSQGKETFKNNLNEEQVTLHRLNSEESYNNDFDKDRYRHNRFGVSSKKRSARSNQKADESEPGAEPKPENEGRCGCSSQLLRSPPPVPRYAHFVGKRLDILTNIVHAIKDWVVTTQ